VQYPLLYPVLAACIAQDRAPRHDELEHVAQRILREGSVGTADSRLDRRWPPARRAPR
jgi:predicted kinase